MVFFIAMTTFSPSEKLERNFPPYETEDRQYRLNYKAERREMINLPPSRLSVKRQKMEF